MVYLAKVMFMKEKIYTIPVNEAFDTDCECPLCHLRKRLEEEAVDYALGAAMMEPDYRIVSNSKGYCNRHFSMMLPKKEKLSLALVLETHMQEVIAQINSANDSIQSLKEEKSSIFKKKEKDSFEVIQNKVSEIINSCVICDKLDTTMARYISVVFYLWEKEEEFRNKLISSKGFCLPHLMDLTEGAKKHLSRKKAIEFIELVYNKEISELERIQNEVHKFTLKFDYRNTGEKWGSEKDSPKRSIEKLSAFVISGEE